MSDVDAIMISQQQQVEKGHMSFLQISDPIVMLHSTIIDLSIFFFLYFLLRHLKMCHQYFFQSSSNFMHKHSSLIYYVTQNFAIIKSDRPHTLPPPPPASNRSIKPVILSHKRNDSDFKLSQTDSSIQINFEIFLRGCFSSLINFRR